MESENLSALTLKEGESRVVFETAPQTETKIVLEKGAHLVHYRLQSRADNVLTASVGQDASYTLITVKLGGGDTRIEASLSGRGARLQSDILYVLKNDDAAGIVTNIRHDADETVSAQLIKGAVYDCAKASFEGGVLIPYDKKAVDGAQQHRALLLSDDAEVAAVPKLEIYSDDVKCAHGSAIGSLDDRQLYYAMTRGIPEQQARALLTQGFLSEILYEIEDESVRGALSESLNAFAGFNHDV